MRFRSINFGFSFLALMAACLCFGIEMLSAVSADHAVTLFGAISCLSLFALCAAPFALLFARSAENNAAI